MYWESNHFPFSEFIHIQKSENESVQIFQIIFQFCNKILCMPSYYCYCNYSHGDFVSYKQIQVPICYPQIYIVQYFIYKVNDTLIQIIWKLLLICFDFSYRLMELMTEQSENICQYSFINDF